MNASVRSPAQLETPYARQIPAIPEFSYFICKPRDGVRTPRPLVSVHGITRNALEHALLFQPWADRLGVVVLAPLFSRARFRRYQTLGGARRGPSAADAFDAMLDDAESQYAIDGGSVCLFGFSGGGQFVHRYALTRPTRIARFVVGAAGWYTFPDSAVDYPYGLSGLDGVRLGEFLRLPSRVIVGERDDRRDEVLNQAPEIDLLQGRSRIERGRRWVDAVNAVARAMMLPEPCGFQLLPKANHAFGTAMRRHRLGHAVTNFLFDQFPATHSR